MTCTYYSVFFRKADSVSLEMVDTENSSLKSRNEHETSYCASPAVFFPFLSANCHTVTRWSDKLTNDNSKSSENSFTPQFMPFASLFSERGEVNPLLGSHSELNNDSNLCG